MDLHLVGGFLGSGKTTAIIGAAKHLLAAGKRVGVVTNDQGKYLVDTAFVRLAGVPTVEVTGGCFCCNYDDLDAHLDRLVREVRPDVIFAESVGSCADIVATVVKPLLELRPAGNAPASYSVFVDARLLQLRLAGVPMPFSDPVTYIFDKQMEEAGLLVLNKADLLEAAEQEELLAAARQAFPHKTLRLQNSREEEQVAGWVELIGSHRLPLPEQSLQIDYDTYAAGEAELAWLNEEFVLSLPPGEARDGVIRFITALLEKVGRAAIGHLKFLIQPEGGPESKLSFTTLSAPGDWTGQIPAFDSPKVRVLVNARVEMGAQELHERIEAAAAALPAGSAVQVGGRAEYFHPSYPRPLHRIA